MSIIALNAEKSPLFEYFQQSGVFRLSIAGNLDLRQLFSAFLIFFPTFLARAILKMFP